MDRIISSFDLNRCFNMLEKLKGEEYLNKYPIVNYIPNSNSSIRITYGEENEHQRLSNIINSETNQKIKIIQNDYVKEDGFVVKTNYSIIDVK